MTTTTTTITTTEIEGWDQQYGIDGEWCQANLAHDPQGAFVGYVDVDYEDRAGSRMVWTGAWQITTRTGGLVLACEDCAGCIDEHLARLGEPDEGREAVLFKHAGDGSAECVANIQHNHNEGGNGQYAADYGHLAPRPHLVCGGCLESIVADLGVMGWPADIEHAVEGVMSAAEFLAQLNPQQPVPSG